MVREEARVEIEEQCHEARNVIVSAEAGAVEGLHARREKELLIAGAESAGAWKVMDRYCWFCGTRGAVFTSASRCSKCGELQRLYVREDEPVGS
jgi:hypothetical protein